MRDPHPIRYQQTADLPYRPEQVFDLVADIERYPEFLAEYRSVRIRARQDETLIVEQVVGVTGIELAFQSVALLHRPESISIRSEHPFFPRLGVDWRFHPAPRGCRVNFCMEIRVASGMLGALAGHWLKKAGARAVSAFVQRAREVYRDPAQEAEQNR
jgi:coenzyme Q-binding protein COQ10